MQTLAILYMDLTIRNNYCVQCSAYTSKPGQKNNVAFDNYYQSIVFLFSSTPIIFSLQEFNQT